MLEPICLSSKVLNVKPGPGVEPSSLILRKSDWIMPVLRVYKALLAPGKYVSQYWQGNTKLGKSTQLHAKRSTRWMPVTWSCLTLWVLEGWVKWQYWWGDGSGKALWPLSLFWYYALYHSVWQNSPLKCYNVNHVCSMLFFLSSSPGEGHV